MDSEIKYPGRFKVWLVSVCFDRYRMVRTFAKVTNDLKAVFVRLYEKAFSGQNGGDYVRTEKMIIEVWRLRHYAVHELIHPMLDYREPLDYLEYQSRPFEKPSTKSEMQELLQNLHEDINLIYRNDYRKLGKLNNTVHPAAGKMSAKEWLVFTLLYEKSVVKQLSKSLNI